MRNPNAVRYTSVSFLCTMVLFVLMLVGCTASEEECSGPLESSGDTTIVRKNVEFEISGDAFTDGVAEKLISLDPDGSEEYSIPSYVGGDDCVEIYSVRVRAYKDENIVERVTVRGPKIGDELGHEAEGRFEYDHGGVEPMEPDDCEDVEHYSGEGSKSRIDVEYEDNGFAGLILAGYWKVELLERLAGGICDTPESWGDGMDFDDIEKVEVKVKYKALAPAGSLGS